MILEQTSTVYVDELYVSIYVCFHYKTVGQFVTCDPRNKKSNKLTIKPHTKPAPDCQHQQSTWPKNTKQEQKTNI